jgi:hypothetical protein
MSENPLKKLPVHSRVTTIPPAFFSRRPLRRFGG